ncbi:hypothetical protein JCM15519_23010 [Fundidesulfovibrio butyratiphilus]
MSAKKVQPIEGEELDSVSEKKRPESKYNASLLRECIKEGFDAKFIMEKMNITHKPTLKHFVLKLISQDRQFYDVKGLYLKSSARPYVNKKGEVRINVNKLDLGSLDVNEGDEFAVTVEDNRIILTVI